MPNWVDNVVILDFTKASEKAKQYLERLLAYEQPEESRHEDGRPGLLGMLIPDTEAGSTNEWAYKNWGTKWDVAEFGLTQEGDKVRLCFSTANSDPHAYLTTLDREGVLVEAYAAEPGCDWAYARMGRVSHEFTNICGERERFDDFPELKDILSHYWECADEAEADEAEAEAEAEAESPYVKERDAAWAAGFELGQRIAGLTNNEDIAREMAAWAAEKIAQQKEQP